MTAQGIAQLVVMFVALAVLCPPLGRYMARVYAHDPDGGPAPSPGDRVFLPVERAVYRLLRVAPRREQRWNVYALSLLGFSLFSVVVSYLILRVQGSLPLNPTDRIAVAPFGAFNAAVSFTTNTNWQWFSGEQTISHLSQMTAFTVQNFVSAAAGMAVAVAIIRGFARRQGRTLGNFWVDLVRGTLRILVPISFVGAIVLVGLGGELLQGDAALLGQLADAASAAAATASSPLAAPVAVPLDAKRAATFDGASPYLAALGFDLRRTGERALAVVGVPAILGGRSVPETLIHALFDLAARGAPLSAAHPLLACHAATRDTLPDPGQIRDFLDALDGADFSLPSLHGRPLVTRLAFDELERKSR